MLSRCDECGKDYEVEFQTKEVDANVHKTFFVCSHCNHEYLAYIKDQNIIDKQADIQKMYVRLHDKSLPYAKKLRMSITIKKKEDAVQAEMNALKDKYS